MKTLLLGLGLLGLACHVDPGTGKTAIGVVGQGLVNDPSNKSLRFDIIRFGLDEFCRELLLRGAPIRLADDQPVIGRFFAKDCEAKTAEDFRKSTVFVQFGGPGFAWTPGTGRLGFEARGLLELSPDFRLHGDALYVYFRPVRVDTSYFKLKMTERSLARAVTAVAGLDEAELGRAIISAQLGRGFTVIRYDEDGLSDFALGLVPEGNRPFRPFSVASSPQTTLANGRTELNLEEQDFLGRIRLEEGQAVTLTVHVEGTKEVDVALVKTSGDLGLIDHYVEHPGPSEGAKTALWSSVATSIAPFRATIPAPAGDYYLVFDYSKGLGTTAPPKDALPARIDYLVQVGSAPKTP